MRSHSRAARWTGVALLAALVAGAASAAASDRVKGVSSYDPEAETVDLFAGVESGALDVQFIPKDEARCRLLVANKSKRPLNVRVPDVLAAAPVLGQMFGPQAVMNNGQNTDNAGQAVGVPFMLDRMGGGRNGGGNQPLFNVPGVGQPGMNPGFGRGIFCVAPEAVGQFKLQSVCLEHGKPTPRAAMAYRLVPIEKVCPKPELAEVLRGFGRGELSQKATQAAAWHLSNGMSWKEVAAIRIRHVFVSNDPFFTSAQIAQAKKAVEKAAKELEKSSQNVASTQR